MKTAVVPDASSGACVGEHTRAVGDELALVFRGARAAVDGVR